MPLRYDSTNPLHRQYVGYAALLRLRAFGDYQSTLETIEMTLNSELSHQEPSDSTCIPVEQHLSPMEFEKVGV